MPRLAEFRCCCQDCTSVWSSSAVAIRCPVHCRSMIPISISAIFSQLACVYRLQQILDERHKVHLGAAGGDLDAAALALGFDGHKNVACPGPFVFVVFVGTLARLHRDWRTGLPE